MVVCLVVYFYGFAVYGAKGFSESDKKKYEVSMKKEDEKSLKAKENEASVNISSTAQTRRKSYRAERDIRNRMLALIFNHGL